MTEKGSTKGDFRYLVSAALLVVVVAVLALVFGVVRPPALAGLSDAQRAALPGGIAWAEYTERGDCAKITIAHPIGEEEVVACLRQVDRILGWTDEGIVTLSWTESGDMIATRDPATGEILSSREVAGWMDQPPEDVTGGFTVERVDGVLVLANRSGTTVWETEADARYEIGVIVASPDGGWVAMTDSAERLLVVRADGSEPPAVWATGVRDWAWEDLVWEGTEPPTS